MQNEEMQCACELLYDHWRQGTRIDALPAQLGPSSRAEAYRVQGRIERYSGEPLFGWKIAATSTAGQAHIGVDGPLAGRILAERVLQNGGECQLGNNLMKVAELEFAFRMGDDIAPRAEPYSVDEVIERVADLLPAIEIPDSRYNDFEHAGLEQLIADNACAHLFVPGESTDDDWRQTDLSNHKVTGIVSDGRRVVGTGANVLGNPCTALTWLANELARHGIALKAGQVVTTGTRVVPITLASGLHVRGDFGRFGTVDVTIV